MKTYTHFIWLLGLVFCACKTPYSVVSNEAKRYKVEAGLTDTLTEVAQLLKPYRDGLNTEMNTVIGTAETDFIKVRPGGSLGNLVVDALFEKALEFDPKACNAICNYGGIRIAELPKGPITTGKIFELLPFDNELVLLSVTGDVLQKWVALMDSAGGWPIRKPIQFQKSMDNQLYYNDTLLVEKTNGNLNLEIRRVPIHSDSLYVIATNDYIANGGDQCTFLKSSKCMHTGLLLRDVMIAYIKKHFKITTIGHYTIHE